MKYILAARNRRRLLALARDSPLLAFDFDGTLAPIVPDRDKAGMHPATARLLREVSARYPCAVISGRSRKDVEQRLGDVPVRHIVGDHGADAGTPRPEFRAQMAEILPRLRRELAGQPGVDVENKGGSLAVHYRLAPAPAAARQLVDAAVVSIGRRVRIIPGKYVVNVVPAHAAHKGDALRQLLLAEGADCALYVGDDDTDEDVFGLEPAARLLSVRVGYSRRSQAEYFLRTQREIDTLLTVLIAA